MNHAPAADAATRGRHAGLRLAFPLIALTVLVGGVGAFGYRSLSEEIRRETQRTLAVIAEQKRQHIEGWLAEARVDVRMVFTGHSQLEALFEAWLDGGRRDDAAFARDEASEVVGGDGQMLPAESVIEGNILLSEGIGELWDLVCGLGSPTAFSNANAYIGVGDSTTAESAAHTDLQAASNKTYKAMAAT